jgi:hypothetical protein
MKTVERNDFLLALENLAFQGYEVREFGNAYSTNHQVELRKGGELKVSAYIDQDNVQEYKVLGEVEIVQNMVDECNELADSYDD